MSHWADAGDGRATMDALAPGFGHSFAGVALHTGEAGEARARAHGKPAVAEGENIYLSPSVDTHSGAGKRVLAHEMAHVVQQTGAGGKGGASGVAFEAEAHLVGDVVAAGGAARPQLRTGGAVAQGYDSFEHQAMGNDVHQVLEPVLKETTDSASGT